MHSSLVFVPAHYLQEVSEVRRVVHVRDQVQVCDESKVRGFYVEVGMVVIAAADFRARFLLVKERAAYSVLEIPTAR